MRTGKEVTIIAAPGKLLMVKKYLDNYWEYWKDTDRKTRKIKIPS
jgi:hypothetical protein